MMRTNLGLSRGRALGTLALAAALLLSACGPSKEEQEKEARAKEFASIEAAKQALGDLRQQKTELEAQIKALQEGGEAPEEGPSLEELQTQLNDLSDKIVEDSGALVSQAVTYINEAELEVGQEPPPDVLQAIRIKSAEDLEIAMEYVEKGGDYGKAQNIIETSLKVDPDNPDLQEKLAWIKDWRYITKERFDQVKDRMTQAEVREVLGPVADQNTRSFDDNHVGWFYPKDPEVHGPRTAAGVYL